MRPLFIIGSGTDIGKTLVVTALCLHARKRGLRPQGLKPVVSGHRKGDPESDPARILRSMGETPTDEAIAEIAPWRFRAPISPHLAASKEGRSVKLDEIVEFCRSWERRHDGPLIVEGAGGVMSPIADDATCLDLAATLGYPVVLVTGTYLGSISHGLTALSVLRSRSIVVRGVVVSESTGAARPTVSPEEAVFGFFGSMKLLETCLSLAKFAPNPVRLIHLPRVATDHLEPGREARVFLTKLLDDDHDDA